jgi:hypothetical protein
MRALGFVDSGGTEYRLLVLRCGNLVLMGWQLYLERMAMHLVREFPTEDGAFQ